VQKVTQLSNSLRNKTRFLLPILTCQAWPLPSFPLALVLCQGYAKAEPLSYALPGADYPQSPLLVRGGNLMRRDSSHSHCSVYKTGYGIDTAGVNCGDYVFLQESDKNKNTGGRIRESSQKTVSIGVNLSLQLRSGQALSEAEWIRVWLASAKHHREKVLRWCSGRLRSLGYAGVHFDFRFAMPQNLGYISTFW
jgi:hypothetical protein